MTFDALLAAIPFLLLLLVGLSHLALAMANSGAGNSSAVGAQTRTVKVDASAPGAPSASLSTPAGGTGRSRRSPRCPCRGVVVRSDIMGRSPAYASSRCSIFANNHIPSTVNPTVTPARTTQAVVGLTGTNREDDSTGTPSVWPAE